MAKKKTQNESHDWFGDAAENLVRYCLSELGYEVFGSSKWGADACVVTRNCRSVRVEVRSTDNPKRSWSYLKGNFKKSSKNFKVPGIFVAVIKAHPLSPESPIGLDMCFWKVKGAGKQKSFSGEHEYFSQEALRDWVKENFQDLMIEDT